MVSSWVHGTGRLSTEKGGRGRCRTDGGKKGIRGRRPFNGKGRGYIRNFDLSRKELQEKNERTVTSRRRETKVSFSHGKGFTGSSGKRARELYVIQRPARSVKEKTACSRTWEEGGGGGGRGCRRGPRGGEGDLLRAFSRRKL